VTAGFLIEPLGSHDRSAFSCGAPTLDRYLREQASQDVKRLMARAPAALAVRFAWCFARLPDDLAQAVNTRKAG